MSRRPAPAHVGPSGKRHTAGPQTPASPLTNRAVKPSAPVNMRGAAAAGWQCLLSSIAVAVGPLRNLTGDADQQSLVDGFTDDLVSYLVRHGRGFSLRRIVDQKTGININKSGGATEPEIKFLVTGSAQRGNPGMVRVNVRITDATTSEYLWARRYEFSAEQMIPVRTRIIRRISRELHILLLQQEIRRAYLESGANIELNNCLSCGAAALEGELRPDLCAEAQRWFLAALAAAPHNVEALVGLARTCQELASNPWWSDPAAAALASDLGREVVAIALDLAPGHAEAHCIQGMLYSASGELERAATSFAAALALDRELATAHGFAGYNAAFLGCSGNTLPGIERAMRLNRADRRHSIWFFFGGFAELLVGRTEAAIALLKKSLERNPSYGSAQLFLTAALALSGRNEEAVETAAAFRRQYPDCPAGIFEQLWLARSAFATYRAQILPVFDKIRSLGVAT
jgi:adenylate cyclase